MTTPIMGSLPRLFTVVILGLMVEFLPSFGRANDISPATAQQAEAIINATGVLGGLIVHVGCGDGHLTAALRTNDSYLVHGLEADAANVEAAREHIRALGLYGPVSVEPWGGKALPHADSLVNLLVVGDRAELPLEEIDRVLAPYGVAFVPDPSIETTLRKRGYRTTKFGSWLKAEKPYPPEMDEWSHHHYDPSAVRVSRDRLAGPPRSLQWACGPRWARHHSMASVSTHVSAGGRNFYTVDEAPIGFSNADMPEKWKLVARDAFSGVKLWHRPMIEWGTGDRSQHKESKDKGKGGREGFYGWGGQGSKDVIVATRDRLFTVLGHSTPLLMLDAATGKTLRTYEQLVGVNKTMLMDCRLIVKCAKGLLAVDPDLGKTLWSHRGGEAVVTDGKRVCFAVRDEIVALDFQTGEPLWTISAPNNMQPYGKYLVLAKDMLFFSSKGNGGGPIHAYSATDGKPLWDTYVKKGGGNNMNGIWYYVTDDLVWYVGPADDAGKGSLTIGRDLRTGRIKKQYDSSRALVSRHHQRCYRPKASIRYLLGSKEGIELVDLQTGECEHNDWVRATCTLGYLPANGLVYFPPHSCMCCTDGLLNDFNALSARAETVDFSGSSGPTPHRGPAFDRATGQRRAESDVVDDWPTHRADNCRSGSTESAVPAALTQVWTSQLPDRCMPPIIAGGQVFAAVCDRHCLEALDRQTGKRNWTFTAGGRIPAPPTVGQGLVLFGSSDGWVYCLRAADGRELWRFRAAPDQRAMVYHDQLESAWPVQSGVLVQDGVAYCAAGRSSYLDGGIFVYAFDPSTGKTLHRTRVAGPKPDHTQSHGMFIKGLKPDVMIVDGNSVNMRNARFSPDLGDCDLGPGNGGQSPKTMYWASPPGNGLYASSGLLDGSFNHRLFWQIGQATGQMLVYDDTTVYGMKAYTKHPTHMDTMFYPATQGCQLFARDRQPDPKPQDRRRRLPVNTPDEEYRWHTYVPMLVRAMVATRDHLFVAGPPDVIEKDDPLGAYEGRKGGLLWVLSKADGKRLAQHKLESPPVWDGMAAAGDSLYLALENTRVVRLRGE